MTAQEMISKVRELKELQQMSDELTAEIESLKDELKAEMTAEGKDEMTVDVFVLRYKSVSTSRFDSKAFKATHAELYNQYSKTSTSKRFTIS